MQSLARLPSGTPVSHPLIGLRTRPAPAPSSRHGPGLTTAGNKILSSRKNVTLERVPGPGPGSSGSAVSDVVCGGLSEAGGAGAGTGCRTETEDTACSPGDDTEEGDAVDRGRIIFQVAVL